MVMAQAACPSRRVHSSGPLTWLTTAGPRLGSRPGARCVLRNKQWSGGRPPNRIRLQRAATSTSWYDLLAPQSDSVTSSAPRGLASRRVRPHLPDPDVPPLRAPKGDDAVTVRGRDEARRHHHGLPLSPDPERAGRRHGPSASFPGPRACFQPVSCGAGVAYVRGSPNAKGRRVLIRAKRMSLVRRIQRPNKRIALAGRKL